MEFMVKFCFEQSERKPAGNNERTFRLKCSTLLKLLDILCVFSPHISPLYYVLDFEYQTQICMYILYMKFYMTSTVFFS